MLALLPWLLRRLGMKATLMLGIFAWLARFLSLGWVLPSGWPWPEP